MEDDSTFPSLPHWGSKHFFSVVNTPQGHHQELVPLGAFLLRNEFPATPGELTLS